jgi:hypothetical protein
MEFLSNTIIGWDITMLRFCRIILIFIGYIFFYLLNDLPLMHVLGSRMINLFPW